MRLMKNMARPDEDGMITCTGCGRKLPGDIEHFHRQRDAFKPKCKECKGSSFGVHDVNKMFDSPHGMKVCAGCRRTLTADTEHFYRSSKTDGFASQCKECWGGSFGVHRPNMVHDTPEDHKYCIQCRRLLPHDDEHFMKTHHKCKECDGVGFGIHRINRAKDSPDGYKYCAECHELLPEDEDHFYHSGDSFTSKCQDCHNRAGAEWYRENPEKVKAIQRRHYQTDHGKAMRALQKARRRSREESVEHTLTAGQWSECKSQWSDDDGSVHCAYCGAPSDRIERDHVTPITEGGGTTADNIVPVCRSCNASKGNDPFADWYPKQPFHTDDREQTILAYLSEQRAG